ncbi:hypothetical protein ACFOPX_03415 [Helicobacter baculiformis]|uniref:DUF2570 domain-containing protein n=1 Tax=Helicobacter baculiformis TaxID=427351 RepID=A0ABV7ZHF4_9HELI|nr:hypothetical protein [Helicobacter baculiformis]
MPPLNPLILLTCLGWSGLLGAGVYIQHLLKANAQLQERLAQTQSHLQTQNAHIKALERDTKAHQAQTPTHTKIIKERYKDPQEGRALKTCQEQLERVEQLLEIFKKGY